MRRAGGYRFAVGDACSYRKSILQTIQHAPMKNQMQIDYAAVTYFHSEKPTTMKSTTP